ncbi:MAG: flagellar basal body-associated FliL family protein [Treponema sp.]|nr:flagellar basal body-associated FliL family protein [Treponema sp.]
MSDSDELDLDGGEPSELDSGAKKPSGLVALLPNLLKFVAIGLAALLFIITICVITFNILNKQGPSQTIMPDSSPYVGTRPQYSMFTSIGVIRTQTKDTAPYTVVVDMVIGYDQNDNAAAGEMTSRLYELRDFVRSFFRSKTAAELQPENEARLKQEIMETLNTRVLNSGKVKVILFNQLDVMEM